MAEDFALYHVTPSVNFFPLIFSKVSKLTIFVFVSEFVGVWKQVKMLGFVPVSK